jgi:hypothetical protein
MKQLGAEKNRVSHNSTDYLLSEADIVKRFFAKVYVVEKNGCWAWMGATHSPARYPQRKYGEFHLSRNGGKQKVVGSHRFIYELVNGPLLPGLRLDVDHKCRNSLCVNPKHLRAITHQDNLKLRQFGRGL